MDAKQYNSENREPDEIMIPSEDGFIVIPTYSIRGEKSAQQRMKPEGVQQRTSLMGNILQLLMVLAGIGSLMAVAGLAVGEMIGVLSVGLVGGVGLLSFKSGIEWLKEREPEQIWE